MLLAPRKTALALLRWGHLKEDLTVWTTPPELVKQRKSVKKPRSYYTPLPKMARDILSKRKRGDDNERVFPSQPVFPTNGDTPAFYSNTLKQRLKVAGADGLYPHAFRHTCATWLENQGYDLYDRGLVLNHSESGVTAGYSHGIAMKRKLGVHEAWADHVASIIK